MGSARHARHQSREGQLGFGLSGNGTLICAASLRLERGGAHCADSAVRSAKAPPPARLRHDIGAPKVTRAAEGLVAATPASASPADQRPCPPDGARAGSDSGITHRACLSADAPRSEVRRINAGSSDARPRHEQPRMLRRSAWRPDVQRMQGRAEKNPVGAPAHPGTKRAMYASPCSRHPGCITGQNPLKDGGCSCTPFRVRWPESRVQIRPSPVRRAPTNGGYPE